jgi:hypothetical protein
LEQVSDVRGTETGHRVPALHRCEARNVHGVVVAVSQRDGVVAAGDVVEDVVVLRTAGKGVELVVEVADRVATLA